mgnify:CR=1 FL=1
MADTADGFSDFERAAMKERAAELKAQGRGGQKKADNLQAVTEAGKVVCFFQGASKFEARYATLGFNDAATLDDGAMWPTAFAIVEWTPAVEKRVVDLITAATA